MTPPPASMGEVSCASDRLLGRVWPGTLGLVGPLPRIVAGRSGWRAVCVGPAREGQDPVIVFLGGRDEAGLHCNDVWLTNDQGLTWECSSPSEVSDGPHHIEWYRLGRRKWVGREGHAVASGTLHNRTSVYVACGMSRAGPRADVWFSEDLGRSWQCVCVGGPFGCRSGSSLAACPSDPRRLVLSGGLPDGRSALDFWASTDGGSTWFGVVAPGTLLSSCALTLKPLPGNQSRLIVMADGGLCALTGSCKGQRCRKEGKYDRNEKPFSAVATLDWNSRQAEWASLATTGLGAWSGQQAAVAHSAVGHELVVLTSLGFQVAHDPPVNGSGSLDFQLASGIRSALSADAHLLLPADGRRLFVLTGTGLWSTGGSSLATHEELGAQLNFLQLVGHRLMATHGLPDSLWRTKIVPCVLPDPYFEAPMRLYEEELDRWRAERLELYSTNVAFQKARDERHGGREGYDAHLLKVKKDRLEFSFRIRAEQAAMLAKRRQDQPRSPRGSIRRARRRHRTTTYE